MLTTAELRWFYPGKLPEVVLQWFEQDQIRLASAEEREDIYLYVPDSDFVGIKLRQGRLEIKWRKAELGDLHFGKATGKAEKWTKWLCEDLSNECFQPNEVTGKFWVSVKKKRTQRTYKSFADQLVSVKAGDENEEGCNVELTELEVSGNLWWSLAFEAYSKSDRTLENLKKTASRILQNYHHQQLEAKDSYAYPHWLSLVIK